MMEFFEFFFSGPNWGWKVLALIWFTNVFFSGIGEVVNAFFGGKVQKILEEAKSPSTENDEESKDTKATKDDFR